MRGLEIEQKRGRAEIAATDRVSAETRAYAV